jgi:hypothetical protein
MTIILGFFGFYRSDKFSYNFDIKQSSYKKYIFSPTIINEDNDKKCNIIELAKKFGNDTKITLYEYNKNQHIKECNKYCTDKFLPDSHAFQQGYRIFSFFNNIRGVSQLIKNDNYAPEDVIILCRIDNGLTIEDENKVLNLLEDNDVIVTDMSTNCKWVKDHVFIFKYKHIDIFIKLYDNFGLYIQKYKNNEKDKPKRTIPECIFFYHFIKNNLKITKTELIKIHHKHVCSKYCGWHNKYKTET